MNDSQPPQSESVSLASSTLISEAPALDAPHCESHLVHLEKVRQVQPILMSMEKAQQTAEFFGVLADPNRLRLLSALAQQELCVCDLAALAKLSESAVSHQLRLLRSLRLVKYRKEGRNVYYSLINHSLFRIDHDRVQVTV